MSRKINFQAEYYYHICNRGVDKRKVFLEKWDYVRFLEGMKYFNQIKPVGSLYSLGLLSGSAANEAAEPLGEPLVEILAYYLNPNHFHLLLQQKVNNGISEYLHKLLGGYTGYFNRKNNRSGSLWQGAYKAKEIKSTDVLQKLTVYVNCNAEIHHIAKADMWPWSSNLDYISQRNGTLVNKKIILNEVGGVREYIQLCKDLIPEIQKRKDELEDYDLE